MAIEADYRGMPMFIEGMDTENLEYFRYCSDHDFRLQCCNEC